MKMVDVFIDDGYTGSNFDRPEFKRMMKSMKAGELDYFKDEYAEMIKEEA